MFLIVRLSLRCECRVSLRLSTYNLPRLPELVQSLLALLPHKEKKSDAINGLEI